VTCQWRKGKLLGYVVLLLAITHISFGDPSRFFTRVKNKNFFTGFLTRLSVA